MGVHRLHAKCTRNEGLGEAIHHEVLHLQELQSRGRVDKKKGAEARQETRSPRAGRLTCHAQQPPPVTGCEKVWSHTAPVRRAFFEATVAGTNTRCSSCTVGRPSPCWSPLFGGRLFLWGAEAREGRHLVSSGSRFCPQARKDTSLEQCVGRLNHDRTTVRAVPPSSPQSVTREHRGSPRHVSWGSCCAIIISPFSSESSTRLGRGTLAGSSPAPCGASWALSDSPDGAVTALVCMTTGAGQTGGTLLGVPSPLFRGAARCWPSAGLLVGGQLVRPQVTPGSPDVVCHCGGTGDRGTRQYVEWFSRQLRGQASPLTQRLLASTIRQPTRRGSNWRRRNAKKNDSLMAS